MITAVVTSDNHLGAYWARLRPDRLEQRRRNLQKNFERVVDAALAMKADLFLQAGDLFDRPDPRNAERLFVARQFARLRTADTPVFAIAGNHDSPRSLGYDGGTTPHQEAAEHGAIRLFRGMKTLQSELLEINGIRVRISGKSSDFNLPHGSCPLEGACLEAEREQREEADVKIVLLHYSVEGWAPPLGREPVLSLENLNCLDADAICVGHLHKKNERRLPGGALLLNPGATEHINFGEESFECGFWVLRFDGKTVESQYHALPTQSMRTQVFELDTENEERENLTEQLCAEIEAISEPEQLLRFRLRGELRRDEFQKLDLGKLAEAGNARNFLFQLDVEHLQVLDQWGELTLGFGAGFDVREELQSTARAMESVTVHSNAEQTRITQLAARTIEDRFSQWTGTESTSSESTSSESTSAESTFEEEDAR